MEIFAGCQILAAHIEQLDRQQVGQSGRFRFQAGLSVSNPKRSLVAAKSGYRIRSSPREAGECLEKPGRFSQLMDKFLALPCRKMFMYGEQNAGLSYLAHIQQHGVRLSTVPHCGHFPMYSNPVFMWGEIADFVS